MNLDTPAGNLRAFMSARASTDGSDAVTWFAGSVHAWTPDGKSVPVFGFEGYNVARAVEVEGGFDLLTREAAFYLDPRTREIVDAWKNPWTDADVEVVHVWNDPVNFRFREQMPWGPFAVPYVAMGDDIMFTSDVFLAYPSPLPRAQFPDNSQDDLYTAAELFGFYCKRADLEAGPASVPALISWTRIAPWLPFMRMGDRPGRLVYHCRGAKLGSFDELPSAIRDVVESRDPAFKRAPTEFTEPNETSWTFFRKLVTRA